MIEGVSIREVLDEATGISNKVVVDWKQQPKGSELRPRVTLRDKKGEVVNLPNGIERATSCGRRHPQRRRRHPCARRRRARAHPARDSKTRDITGGLPRVAELFEARKPKDFAIIAELSGTIEFGKDYKAKRRIILHPDDDKLDTVEHLIPKASTSRSRRATTSRRAIF